MNKEDKNLYLANADNYLTSTKKRILRKVKYVKKWCPDKKLTIRLIHCSVEKFMSDYQYPFTDSISEVKKLKSSRCLLSMVADMPMMIDFFNKRYSDASLSNDLKIAVYDDRFLMNVIFEVNRQYKMKTVV